MHEKCLDFSRNSKVNVDKILEENVFSIYVLEIILSLIKHLTSIKKRVNIEIKKTFFKLIY